MAIRQPITANTSRPTRGASAHYFVDENEICQSIEDQKIAWHCGATGAYRRPECRNSNSLGSGLCSRKEGGIFYFKQETVEHTVALVKYLMKLCNVPAGNVIRHDATGKICPAPLVNNEMLCQGFIYRFRRSMVAAVILNCIPRHYLRLFTRISNFHQ